MAVSEQCGRDGGILAMRRCNDFILVLSGTLTVSCIYPDFQAGKGDGTSTGGASLSATTSGTGNIGGSASIIACGSINAGGTSAGGVTSAGGSNSTGDTSASAGCVATPVTAAIDVESLSFVLVGGPLAFKKTAIVSPQNFQSLVLCPASDCSNPTILLTDNPVGGVAGYSGFSTDIYYSVSISSGSSGVKSILRCVAPQNGACTSTDTILNTAYSSILLATQSTLFYEAPYGDAGATSFYAIRVDGADAPGTALELDSKSYPFYSAYDTNLYGLIPSSTPKLGKCPASGCQGKPTTALSPASFSPKEIVVDADGDR